MEVLERRLAPPCRRRRARRPRRARCSCRGTSPPRSANWWRRSAPRCKAGKSRKEAIYAAYDRFYKGDIARELVRGVQEEGGLITLADLAAWKVRIEEPLSTTYKGITVYKLPIWQQGPVMLQALNILENTDLKSMGYNSPRYIHTLYQTMNLAYADRDFYYGDPYFPPDEPVKGLLSKEYAKARYAQINWTRNDSTVKPGDPYPFQGGTNPFADSPRTLDGPYPRPTPDRRSWASTRLRLRPAQFYAGTTSIEAADEEGWVVSVTPSGGWIPAVIAGHTGVGLSQRAQSFVTRRGGRALQRDRAGKAPAGHAHSYAGDEGRHAVPRLCGTGR